ncbi:TRAPP II complex [Aspergillus coremiiformis]|uniref:TRAPP II complex n=1 Tax=Aspergillus coremiiformis TaxID=138285 RepID=A0A5N6YU71_9EURO|nr:TRAPP II complex [Aspergillus coremiiformis]
MFSPLAFPTGMILYDLTFSVPPTSHLELFPFEIYREPLVVISIADGAELSGDIAQNGQESTVEPKNEASPTPAGLDQLRQQVELTKERNPRALVHQLLVFDYKEIDKLVNGPDDILWIPRPEASKATTMKTVLCDITSLLLSELDGFARTVQSIPSIESPRASSWGPHRGPDIRPRATDRLFHRMTMPAQLPSNPNSTPETPLSSSQSSPAPSDHETPTTFDEITRSIQLSNRSTPTGKLNSLPSSKEHSRDRMSVSSMSATDRTKNRIKGRAGVVIGTLFLQAGRWPDALKELVEAASNARVCSDYVWHAKALESILLCLLMFAWAGMDFQIPPICYPVADKSSKSSFNVDLASGSSAPGNRVISLQNLSNLLPDLSNNILNLYNRAANIANAPLPQLIFSETVIRLSRLLVAARIRDGALDDIALKHIVMGEPLQPLYRPERPRGLVILRKSEIMNFLLRALPLSPGSDLPATDAIPIMIGVVSVFDSLGLPRKKAFILRELLSILVPTLVQARKIGAAEVGIHPAAGLASLSDTAFDINALDVGPGNMEESMRSLLATIGKVYGVQHSSFYEWEKRRAAMSNGAESLPEYDSVAAIVERSFRHAVLDGYGDLNLKIDVLKACINACEALPDFGGVLRFTVELLQTIRGDLMLGENFHVPPYLPQDEQIRLLNNIKRTVGAANKLGASGVEAEYWDDFLVRGVQLLTLSDSRSPVRRSKSELDAVTADREKSTKDPFLYNPFQKPGNKTSELLMVAGEHATFQLTLQNPYEFEIEIEKLRLDSEGVPLDAVAEWIVIRPLSLQDITISGLPHEEGVVKITGCFVKVRHCRERRFPIFKSLWRPEAERKFKRTGLAAKQPLTERPLSWSSTTSRDGKQLPKKGPDTSSCEIKVIGRQPSLVIESLSLSQSAFMVLEGEVGSFKTTLRNTSPCPLDFIMFTFQDSTTRQIQNALSNRDLLPAEVYELELKLSKPALRWRREGKPPGDHSIPPGQCATFTVDIIGKAGLQDTTVQIDYSCVGQSRELPDVFYTRQLFVPLTVTVNASVEIARCDILPFSGDFAWWNCQGTDSEIEPAFTADTAVPPRPLSSDLFSPILSHLGRGTYGSDHCLVLLDLRNAWPSPLTVSLQASEPVESEQSIKEAESKGGHYTVSGELQPGQTSRFVLVLPRVYLDNPHASIPVLNTGAKRQFVVSAHKLSFDAEAASREAFWYREELLKRVSGRWAESPVGRKGMIDLRNLRFSSRMVDAFRLEDVDMTFALSPSSDTASSDDNSVVQIGWSKYNVQTDEMLNLRVTIRNRSSRPIHPLLRLQPSLRHQPNNIALDLSKRLAWTGMLQQVLPIIHSGESATATLGVTILCRGEYEFGASVEELRLLRPSESEGDPPAPVQGPFHDDDGPIKDTFGIDVAKKRRIWHAKEACVMNAHC